MSESSKDFIAVFLSIALPLLAGLWIAAAMDQNMTKEMSRTGYAWVPAHWERSK